MHHDDLLVELFHRDALPPGQRMGRIQEHLELVEPDRSRLQPQRHVLRHEDAKVEHPRQCLSAHASGLRPPDVEPDVRLPPAALRDGRK